MRPRYDPAMPTKLDEIVAHKRTEVAALAAARSLASLRDEAESAAEPVRDFAAALRTARVPGQTLAVIAEIKRASPSAGTIAADIDPAEVAQRYAAAGAACISVLTDGRFFGGSDATLQTVRRCGVTTPLLRKDFLIDPLQLYQARAIGADAVLLIAECLPGGQLGELHALTRELGMHALVELYDEANLDRVLAIDPAIVGVNNRDLRTFAVDIEHSRRLRERVPANVLFVSESGLKTAADTEPLRASQVDAILVGETLMRADDTAAKLAELSGRQR